MTGSGSTRSGRSAGGAGSATEAAGRVEAGTRPRRGRADKAAAIVRAGCEVFGRDGYSRATVDLIAAQAGASTRTLYNHFPGGKEELFRAVMEWSASRVGQEQLTRLRRYVDLERPPRPEDLERDLLALARSWVGLMADFPDHFSLVRHIYAEAGHIPAEALEAWREAGPRAVMREVTEVMAVLAEHGLIDAHGDAAQAGEHFVALITTDVAPRSYWGLSPLPEEETDRVTASGVRAFLRAYGPTGGDRPA